jgi:hypothetical protein
MLGVGNQYKKELQSDVLAILNRKINTKEELGKSIEDKENENLNNRGPDGNGMVSISTIFIRCRTIQQEKELD